MRIWNGKVVSWKNKEKYEFVKGKKCVTGETRQGRGERVKEEVKRVSKDEGCEVLVKDQSCE